MGFEDKADAKKDQFVGKSKKAVGKVTGDSKTQAEGESQDLKGKIKDTTEQVKDTAGDVKDQAKGFMDGFKK